METVAYILYTLSNRGLLLLPIAIFGTIAGVSYVLHLRKRLTANEPAVYGAASNSGRAKLLIARFVTGLCIVAIFGFLAFSVFNIFRPHLVDGWLMNAVGARANAVVTNVEATNNRHNKNTVMRHDILFKTADGTPVETYFHTWDFNIYPSASSVRYPQQGQQFRVLYLPSYPTTFLILTEEDSPYSKQNDCGDLIKALEAAKIKHDFYPKDPKFKAALDEAAKKVIDAKCGTVTVDGNSF